MGLLNFSSLNRTKSGYTLLELLVIVALVGILAVVAMPSFVDMISSNRVKSDSRGLISALKLARLEAIKRGQHVVIAPTGTDWKDGVRSWVDANRDGVYDADELVLKELSAISGDASLTSSDTSIVFLSTGFISGSAMTQLKLKSTGSGGCRFVTILVSGRIRNEGC